MVKKNITYNNYEGQPETKTFYFNLSRFEWLELEAYTKGGLTDNLKHALETNNLKKTIDLLKRIILRAYGERDLETGEFIKNDDLAIKFSKTEAFSELFYELAYDEKKSNEFFSGLIPFELREQVKQEQLNSKGTITVLPSNTTEQ